MELNAEEYKLISRVLYNQSWTGQQWQQTVTPLINKIAGIIDSLEKPEKPKEVVDKK